MSCRVLPFSQRSLPVTWSDLPVCLCFCPSFWEASCCQSPVLMDSRSSPQLQRCTQPVIHCVEMPGGLCQSCTVASYYLIHIGCTGGPQTVWTARGKTSWGHGPISPCAPPLGQVPCQCQPQHCSGSLPSLLFIGSSSRSIYITTAVDSGRSNAAFLFLKSYAQRRCNSVPTNPSACFSFAPAGRGSRPAHSQCSLLPPSNDCWRSQECLAQPQLPRLPPTAAAVAAVHR